MKHLDRIRTDPSLWLLLLMVGSVAAALLYMVLISINY
jgi:hypothetical protein